MATENLKQFVRRRAGDCNCEGVSNTANQARVLCEELAEKLDGTNILGNELTITGAYAHAEGDSTVAAGAASHSECYRTTANGNYSHAEGNKTVASGRSTHVEGEYNIEDVPASGNTANRSKYVHIVGNGTSNNNRSNAHTLDWNGNAWYAGTVEGTAVIVKSSTANSTKRFKITVDDSGTISATEVT